ncbi:hypothetical protein F441_03838, partial [Phytophthora nicotianae CJ01A1]
GNVMATSMITLRIQSHDILCVAPKNTWFGYPTSDLGFSIGAIDLKILQLDPDFLAHFRIRLSTSSSPKSPSPQHYEVLDRLHRRRRRRPVPAATVGRRGAGLCAPSCPHRRAEPQRRYLLPGLPDGPVLPAW